MSKEKPSRSRTKISEHAVVNKKLIPPLAGLPNLSHSSWIDDRLPEMLWAVLFVSAFSRKEALSRFEAVVTTACAIVSNMSDEWRKNPMPLTLPGIATLPEIDQRRLIKSIAFDDTACVALRPMLLLSGLPSRNAWEDAIGMSNEMSDWETLAQSVFRSFVHQSQEATDCRWAKALFGVRSGLMNFMNGTHDVAIAVLNYPSHEGDDLSGSRARVRSLEIAFRPEADTPDEDNWASQFWKECYECTGCLVRDFSVQEFASKFPVNDQLESDRVRLNEANQKLTNHYWQCIKTTSLDSRHQVAFGIALYAADLVTSSIALGMGQTAQGRMTLRSLAECLITLSFLAKTDDSNLWEAFRIYGEGQAKLVCQKSEEEQRVPDYLDQAILGEIANEDKWVEFLPVNFGHWDASNLRKMAEEVGLKHIYDDYYTWPSSYSHGQWGAIRESVYEMCGNPLHRFHRVPLLVPLTLPECRNDFFLLLEAILSVLYSVYPTQADKSCVPDEERSSIG